MYFSSQKLTESAVLSYVLPELQNKYNIGAEEKIEVKLLSDRQGGSIVFQLSSSDGQQFIARFPSNAENLNDLKKEERLYSEIGKYIKVRIPDTTVIESVDGQLPVAFALHRMVQGEPLTEEIYFNLTAEARARLVNDLVELFAGMHSIALHTGSQLLDMDGTLESVTASNGKPGWFRPDDTMRSRLQQHLNEKYMRLFDRTVLDFAALDKRESYMIFGHGDLHGFNMAIGEDEIGAKLVGIFDFGNAGLLDIHEDLFRLHLVSGDLLESVVEAYTMITNNSRCIDLTRARIYYVGFVFYLMNEQIGYNNLDGLPQLSGLLDEYIDSFWSK